MREGVKEVRNTPWRQRTENDGQNMERIVSYAILSGQEYSAVCRAAAAPSS